MAYSIGNVSGCHINPAVSFAMLLTGRMELKDFLWYVLSQIIGAFVGAILLGLCLRGNFTSLGGNQIQAALMKVTEENIVTKTYVVDVWSCLGAFLVETILTFVFVITILGVTDERYHDGKHAGIVIGLSLALVHLFGLGFTGTSVNPARSIAPAVLQAIAGNTTSLSQIWIWILAPLCGAALASFVYLALTKGKEKKLNKTNQSTM